MNKYKIVLIAGLSIFIFLFSRRAIAGNSIDTYTLARTIWGEARGEGVNGMQAVANVIINRYKQAQADPAKAKQYGSTIEEICKKPYQFSAWNADDPNRAQMLTVTISDPMFREALNIAEKAINGTLQDIVSGADHYHTATVNPSWSSGVAPVNKIGSHLFYVLGGLV